MDKRGGFYLWQAPTDAAQSGKTRQTGGTTMRALGLAAALGLTVWAAPSQAAEVKILTAGAMKEVVLAVMPAFEKETGHKATVSNDTAGGLAKRIEGGEAFDLVVITPGAAKELAAKGKVAGNGTPVARVGVGVVVKEGATLPDISSVEAFKTTLKAAKTVA